MSGGWHRPAVLPIRAITAEARRTTLRDRGNFTRSAAIRRFAVPALIARFGYLIQWLVNQLKNSDPRTDPVSQCTTSGSHCLQPRGEGQRDKRFVPDPAHGVGVDCDHAGDQSCSARRCRQKRHVAAAPSPCRSPIEMSPASPIEMSLGQAVVATFGVACDGGDSNERAGADAASCSDRSIRRSSDG